MAPNLLGYAVGALLMWAAAPADIPGAASSAATVADAVYVPAGWYTPLYASTSKTLTVQRLPVAPFYADVTAVTHAAYAQFLQAQPNWHQPAQVLADAGYLQAWQGSAAADAAMLATRPITQVSWFAARAYCQWRNKRLPTVAEWERLAEIDTAARSRVLQWYSQTHPWPPAPVRSTAVNALGVWDLHGLIWEWTEDFNNLPVAGDVAARFACGAAVGAQDAGDYPAFARQTLRSSLRGNYTLANLGFRCVADVPPER